jgi:hypothetical protein
MVLPTAIVAALAIVVSRSLLQLVASLLSRSTGISCFCPALLQSMLNAGRHILAEAQLVLPYSVAFVWLPVYFN